MPSRTSSARCAVILTGGTSGSELFGIETQHRCTAAYPGKITRRHRQEMVGIKPGGLQLRQEKGGVTLTRVATASRREGLARHQPAGANCARQLQIRRRTCGGQRRIGINEKR